MSWVSLGDALETALAKALETDGEAGSANPAVSRENWKRAASIAPAAKVTRLPTDEGGQPVENKPGQESPAPSTMDRGMSVASRAGRPTQATGIPVFMVYEGGRQTPGGNSACRPFARAPLGRASKLLKLVVSR